MTRNLRRPKGVEATCRVACDGPHTELARSLEELVASEDGSEFRGVTASDHEGLVRQLNGIRDVVLLAPLDGPEVDGTTVGGVDLLGAKRMLDALSEISTLEQLIVVSSAMVYGAREDNPEALDESAPLRADHGVSFAADKATLEHLVRSWHGRNSAVRLVILRPTLTVSADLSAVNWLERSLWFTAGTRVGDAAPPRQFLHRIDLARAIEHCRRSRLSGVFNVAPDGALSAAEQLELVGRVAEVRMSEPAAEQMAKVRWRFNLTSTPPEILPYTRSSWVVSNAALRATGWEPMYTNAEAFVVGHRESWWSSLSARRRQEISLGATVVGVAGVAVSVAAGVARWMRSR